MLELFIKHFVGMLKWSLNCDSPFADLLILLFHLSRKQQSSKTLSFELRQAYHVSLTHEHHNFYVDFSYMINILYFILIFGHLTTL